jgi:hypothetical protein
MSVLFHDTVSCLGYTVSVLSVRTVWNIGGMIPAGENENTGKTACANATLFTTRPTWTGLGIKPVPLQ